MIDTLIERYPELAGCRGEIEAAAERLIQAFAAGGQLLVCGNGGSCADSGHIVGELMKGFRLLRPLPAAERERLEELYPQEGAYLAEHLQGALPAIALPDQTAVLTAFGNDVAADMGFAQLVYGYGRSGDVLLAISTSGNSRNVVNAARIARFRGMTVIGLTGFRSGQLDALSQVVIHAPGEDTAAVQEHHLPIYHALCSMCEDHFFGNS